jgi:hypothetical protein
MSGLYTLSPVLPSACIARVNLLALEQIWKCFRFVSHFVFVEINFGYLRHLFKHCLMSLQIKMLYKNYILPYNAV